MFSGNQKISCRQLYRGYTAGLISLGALLAPLAMNRENLTQIVFALLLLGGWLLGTVYVPRPASPWIRMLSYLHYWVIGTMAARMTGLLIQEFLLDGTALWLILGWFYLFCFYNLYKGAECRGRVGEILFPFFIVLLLFLTAMMWGEIELERCFDLRPSLGARQLQAGYQLFCWLGAVQGLWYLRGQTAPEGSFKRTVGKIWLTGAAVILAFSVFSYCIYGDAGHTGLVFPMASAMTLAHFPGKVVGRLDALFVFAWVIGLFLLCSTLFAPLKDGEPGTREKYLMFALLAASFAAALNPACMDWGQDFLYMISTPLQILILFCMGLRRLGKGGRKTLLAVALALFPALLLTGCGGQELEERSLVMAVSVDPGQEEAYHLTFGFGASEDDPEEPFETEAGSMQEAKDAYYDRFQKQMDFNHLKNFYFSEKILDSEEMGPLLEELQTDGAYSRGTSVYITEGAASDEARLEEQPESGTPLHRILNAWYNEEFCRIPLITEDHLYKGEISWPYSE